MIPGMHGMYMYNLFILYEYYSKVFVVVLLSFFSDHDKMSFNT